LRMLHHGKKYGGVKSHSVTYHDWQRKESIDIAIAPLTVNLGARGGWVGDLLQAPATLTQERLTVSLLE